MLFLPVHQPRPCAVFQMLSFKFVDKDAYHDIAQENILPYLRIFVKFANFETLQKQTFGL
jgi:hypothetical protein